MYILIEGARGDGYKTTRFSLPSNNISQDTHPIDLASIGPDMDKMDIVTRGKRIDYFVLNDGSDEEALPKIDSIALRPMTRVIVFVIPRSFPLSQPQQLSLHRRFQMMLR
ncbi:hypothetical protein LIPSTDRAFT_190776 [Lipomyces starkeyi NRRL Y-11557]|uniref:Uncharacterized protein n=1 Tax=Lipomyces starkeyi NRRL Y-11557 TaxID=675824 RepID=A0A1E3PXN9_LIPST|nr:hypothetical protein LIPSTDRAFT_190776 [Lipomyces starkeyi NRRL Y-11557]